jgi:hypothetical protein
VAEVATPPSGTRLGARGRPSAGAARARAAGGGAGGGVGAVLGAVRDGAAGEALVRGDEGAAGAVE